MSIMPATHKEAFSARAQEIYLIKRAKVLVEAGEFRAPGRVVMTIQANLEALGFALSPALLARLRTLGPARLVGWYQATLPILRNMVGAHKRFNPMYPNFPAQVMEATEAELWWNATLHYFSAWLSDVTGDKDYVWLPSYAKQDRDPLTAEDKKKFRVIDLGDVDDFNGIFTALCGSNSSLSETDKANLAWFVEAYKDEVAGLVPEKVPQRETLAMLAAQAVKHCNDAKFVTGRLKTATDVLRVAAVMSNGGVSLAQPTRYRRMRRKERRFLLGTLEACAPTLTEDMLRYPEMWKRLGRELRPGDYSKAFPKTFQAFRVIRNDLPYATFASQVEAAIGSGALERAVDLLGTRPGMFARRLDHLLRLGAGMGEITLFLAVADQVSTPVLLQVYNHFKNRQTHGQRAFMPKGAVAKMQVPDEPLPPIDGLYCDALRDGIRTVLVERFAKLPPLGRCYIDPVMRQQIVPFAMRSASKSLRTIARGSRIPLADGGTIRFFLWWKDGHVSADIDLSAMQLGPRFENMGAVAYYQLRWGGEQGGENVACHSGDITSAPKGACEFIDVDIEKMRNRGVQYVVMCINSYTKQSFCDLPECFAGWMMRSEPNSGEVFEARTVQDKVDLAADTTVGVPVIIDLVNRQVIWVDLGLTGRRWINNVAWHGGNLTKLAKVMTNLNRPNLYDLFSMHVEARGDRVESPAEADTKFGLYEGVTPFDVDTIMSQYMG